MSHRWRTFAAAPAILLSLLLITTDAAAVPAASRADARALLQFKLAVTSDLAGLLSLWSVAHHCSWPGVSCDSASRVTALNISAAGGGCGGGIPVSRGCPNETRRLTGTLSPALGALSELRLLSLPFHRFYGEIPSDIWRLGSLEHLNLEGNSFSGSLPSLFPLSLLSLNLAGNSITGLIPLSLSSCSSLETLDLSRNNFNGTIATSLASLPKLRKLSLSFNRLTGPVPGFKSGCRTLEQLDLAGNLLSGSIPGSLGLCSELRVLDLSRNALSGTIPLELGQCKELSVLVLTNFFDLMNIYSDEFNYFQGGLPESITALPKLRVLWAPRATVEGDIPSNWGSCESLEMVNLGQNLLTGKVPRVFTRCKNLKFLNLSSNKLAGWLDEELLVPCMDVFDVSGNQLSGSIPKFVYKGCAPSSLPQADLEAGYYSVFAYKARVGTSLPYFEHGGDYAIYHNFGKNNFTGNLPSLPIDTSRFGMLTVYAFLADGNYLTGSLNENLFRKCKDLNGLIANVSNNMIFGEIPVEIGAMCRSLLVLDIAGNQITGNIPQSFGSVGSLVVLDLSWNRFDGHIPASLGELKDLKSLLLAGNNLSGKIPDVLVQIPALSVLDLSSNSLTGEIPSGVVDLANLNVLILSNNNLSGRIPTGLANLTSLSVFNVSFNNLSGPMPSNASVMGCDSVIGNPLLLQSCHVYALSIPPSDLQGRSGDFQTYYSTPPESSAAKSRSTEFSSIEIASITCAAAIMSVLLALVLLFLYTRKCARVSSAAQSPGRREVTIFTDIGVPLTYESVARATGGFNTSNCIGSGGFGATYKAEVSPGVLLAIKRLSVGRFHGVQQFHAEIKTLGRLRHANLVTLIGYHLSEAEMFLVYNYLPGGNLDRFIQERAKRDVDWRMLHKIALDVACALTYLHEQCAPRILHRDVKPSNILLDNEFNAYLSDFGLARLLGNSETHATTGVAGTFGYVAPEYAMTCRVSNKADVYSYGVVLMELISDKKVWDPSYSPYWSGFSIVNWATKLLDEGRAPEFFAERLWDVAPHDDLLQTFRLAIKCTNETVSDRPAMRQVVRRLKELQPPAL